MPEEVKFQTEPEIALDEIRRAVAAELPRGVVWAESGYGMDTRFREGSSELGLPYVVGLLSTTSVWRPGQGPLPAKARRRTGCPPKRLPRSPDHCPVSVRELVVEMGEKALQRVSRREGIKQQVAIAFCGSAGATRPSGLRARGAAPGAVAAGRMAAQGSRADQVLALEPAAADRAQGAGAVGQAPLDRGAGLFGARAGVGAGHFEGRSWRGFPHHATLCTAAYGFLVAERSRFSSSARAGRLGLAGAELSADYRPRDSPGGRRGGMRRGQSRASGKESPAG